MENRTHPFLALNAEQKCNAVLQMKRKLGDYIPRNVSLDDIRKAMIRLDIGIDTQDSIYVFDNNDINHVYRVILGTNSQRH